MTELRNPDLLYTFLRGDDVYLLLNGSVELDHSIELRTPTGQVLKQKAILPGWRMAHYRSDGTLVGSNNLDLPFAPSRFGVFESGNFLVAGVDPHTKDVKAAILDSGGQVLRMIDLDLATTVKAKSPAWTRRSAVRLPYLSTEIMQDGPDLLAFEPGKNTVLFVTAGGMVRELEVAPYPEYKLLGVFSSEGQLFVGLSQSSEKADASGLLSVSVDRSTGEALARFEYPNDTANGFSCVSKGTFEFLRAAGDSKGVELIQAAPEQR